MSTTVTQHPFVPGQKVEIHPLTSANEAARRENRPAHSKPLKKQTVPPTGDLIVAGLPEGSYLATSEVPIPVANHRVGGGLSEDYGPETQVAHVAFTVTKAVPVVSTHSHPVKRRNARKHG